MYRKGHYGVSLLAFAPVGFVLLRLGAADLALVTGATMLWLAMLPDVDHRLPLVSHRGVTHTLLFAAAVGGVFAAVFGTAGGVLGFDPGGVLGRVGLAGFGFFVGALTVCAHLLGDALTPAGVALLWPLSDHAFTLSVTRADNGLANYALLALGVGMTGASAYLAMAL